ncbi:hypothetical protein VTG60DRAFT_2427 [Thermothelomyces hinnuleus]
MKTFLLPLAILASSAVAQTTSTCAADYIVESCLSTEKAKLGNCGTENYDCLCASWEAILTCYNNCPNDDRQQSDAGQRDIFCGYASQFKSSTSAPSASKTASTPAKATDDQNPTSTGSESSTATSTGSSPTNTNSGADLALNAGGVLAAVAGVVAVVL